MRLRICVFFSIIIYFCCTCYVYANENNSINISLTYASLNNNDIEFVVENKSISAISNNKYFDCLRVLDDNDNKEVINLVKEDVIKDVTVKDYIVYINLNCSKLAGSSLEEYVFINQIVRTLFDTFSEIKGVKFLNNNTDVETLMGHMNTSSIFTR